jgi:serine/threonine protein phosphatase PrpC
VSEGSGASAPSAGLASTPGPTFSFAFNLGKIPDQGEDSDPILRDGRDLGLIAVFDGMGGAGGTVYETPDGPRTGAYLASRLARDVVERRMLNLLEPDWNLNGEAAADDLHRSVREALVERLAELKAPASGLRSRLLRALPTTMALLALQRTQPGGATWACHVLWAGDSRAYAFEAEGARQLTTDDLRDPGDAMANLRRDSVVSNAMSADTDFHVNYRKVELQAPFLVACATDGCFGYVRSPMHFEHLVLSHLLQAPSPDSWSAALQRDITAVTGDDAAMSLLGIGAQFRRFQKLFAPRVEELERQFIGPLEERARAVADAERQLTALRQRQEDITAEIWGRYKPGYERFLRPDEYEDTDSLDHVADRDEAGAEGDETTGAPSVSEASS